MIQGKKRITKEEWFIYGACPICHAADGIPCLTDETGNGVHVGRLQACPGEVTVVETIPHYHCPCCSLQVKNTSLEQTL
jgi:hypothetical protein